MQSAEAEFPGFPLPPQIKSIPARSADLVVGPQSRPPHSAVSVQAEPADDEDQPKQLAKGAGLCDLELAWAWSAAQARRLYQAGFS